MLAIRILPDFADRTAATMFPLAARDEEFPKTN
jgi:hypothetical protein